MDNQPHFTRPAIEQPLRADLFSPEQLARHAKVLAANHRTSATRGTTRLLARLNDNEQILREYNRTTHAANQTRRVTHAAEWLLDNFYLIEEQVQMARRHLPPGYSRELPRLIDGTSAQLPRVYDIVLELIAHLDAQVDAESLQSFVAAYQTVSALKLAELWALPIMLRLALIENLRRVTSRLMIDRHDRNLADTWVRRLESMAEKSPSHVVVVVADMARSALPVSSSFVAEFYKSLSRHNAAVQLARNWLEQLLAQQGLSVEQLVHQDSQTQAADQVSISHSISSLRALSAIDWREFVEAASLVEDTLRKDPAGVYARMDFPTRDRYRHCIEAIGRHGRLSESEVAQKAVQLADAGAREKGPGDRAAHVGYYLLDRGLSPLEAAAEMRWRWRTAVERCIQRFPKAFYMGGILLLTAIGTVGLARQLGRLHVSAGHLLWFAPIFFLCSSQLAVAVINWLAGLVVKPRLLPRLDFSAGITPDCRTMVVVPTILTGPEGAAHLIETLEIHYLANRDRNLYFALLTDFRDAAAAQEAGDDALLEQVWTGIEALNLKYRTDRPNIFFLVHRPRRWNKAENRWMGYERKRGKLAEFNALLRGRARESFSAIVGDQSILPTIKFVITLDTDTRLPREAARQLAGALAHPLNRPKFDALTGIVTEGYGILQPRVGVSLPSGGQSWFVRLVAGDLGIDPYTQAVSNVYQDVFREGSYIGKGIYDVDAFEKAIGGRLPENAVLSHDLIESCYARSALVSDVELYEEHPSRYNVDINRRHRWIRGDWQIAQWLLPRIPGAGAERIANPLSGLSRWKIFDNLRRSLVPVSLLLLLLGNWSWLPEAGALGPLFVLAIVLLPRLLAIATDVLRKPEDFSLAAHLRGRVSPAGRQLAQALLTLAFLPYDAYINLDAITRTLLRLLFTRRRLLEWQTASDAERIALTDLAGFYATMWIAPALAAAAGVWLGFRHPDFLWLAGPFLGLWLAAPAIAWRISQPIPAPDPDLTAQQLSFLRATARRTWRFFDTLVTADENWLPPDNFQEQPAPVVATRTSPTNMGLALLANLAACDFGYLSIGRLIARTQNTFATMQRLDRYRGHFYNWYDTRTLKPLRPLYVSSVDNGNLAGHLLTLGPGLAELAEQKILPPQVFAGLRDTLAVLRDLAGTNPALERLEAECGRAPETLSGAAAFLQRTAEQAAQLAAITPAAGDEIVAWLRALERDCRDHHDDLLFLAPWLELAPWTPPGDLAEKFASLDRVPTLREVSELDQSLCPLLSDALTGLVSESGPIRRDGGDPAAAWLRGLHEASDRASQRIRTLTDVARESAELAEMDFAFLFDPARELFSIGYNVDAHRRDESHYDLLASEARLCSYVAIAQGQVLQDHWFSLGRLLVATRGAPVLVSWSGSMFEYLMPLLVMPNYEHTLLDQSYRGAVKQQIDYGRLRRVPWGISESGYNLTDVNSNYQYRAFGVPGLGLKRGLAEDLVIAPYATLMALMIAPREACENLQRLAADGRCGAYGFYEAVDYTASRLPPGQSSVTVRSFMAHHQGMGLLSLAYLLLDGPMQRRFMACPSFRAADLLLQERVPNVGAHVLSEDLELDESRRLAVQKENQGDMRIFSVPGLPAPQVHLLSNGRYHVAVSSAGGGYSRWRDLALTRWREDATRDCWGTFIYLRDADSGEVWSAAYQPTLRTTKGYEAIFTQARAEFRQQDARLGLYTEICVSPEDDVELRRVTLTNLTPGIRVIELTSYAEVVLTTIAADAAHPAFSNLFVQTEFVAAQSAILCTRRSSSAEEKPPWLLHMVVGQGGELGKVSYETDRARFVGRGRTPVSPAALQDIAPLSNTTGSVLDPIVALRHTITLAPNSTARVDLVMGIAETREGALALAEKYRTPRMVDRAFDLAWTHSQVSLRHLNASEAEAQLYGRLAGALIYADPARRAAASVLLANRRGQSGLWSHGISGDIPIVLLCISDPAGIEIVRQLVQAHSYWCLKGLTVELVILSEEDTGYRQDLHEQIISLIPSGLETQVLDRPGGIFVRHLGQVTAEDRVLLQAVARVVLTDENGSLAEQFERPGNPDLPIPAFSPVRAPQRYPVAELPPRELIFNNGLGGFTPDGREYVITLPPGQMTPAPWVNVLANPGFGTVVAESGSAYTWAENCHEFRLTPWHNDPVADPAGEAFYIRDEQTGQFWSPTPLPARGAGPYVIRHGFGYSVFEHTENGIASELWIYVAMDAPVKFAVLKLRNLSGRPRRLSATGYWEWVLGDLRQKSLLHVQTEVDPKSGALLVRNPYNTEFAELIAFVDVNDPARTLTGDRREFLGRNGGPAQPASLRRSRLSGRVGAGLDPCGAVQVAFDLPAGQERETLFRLGVGRNAAEVQTLIQRFRRAEAAQTALEGVWQYWNRTLGAVHVETPDPAVNLMANGWLLYQTLSCRLWARTGFYQSGGAFGFRDQLQDAMALVHAEPVLTREHLLRAAARQFREGDVQHWWHPPTGRGVRTHCSDDFLWLPAAVCRYVACIADTGVLDEIIPFLEGRQVKPEEESYFDLPNRSAESATLYEHGVRAIEYGLRFGAHGLPLIGSGDWNDGLNRVGREGKGESVWLAFFLCDVLTRFSPLARARHDLVFADRCLAQAGRLREAIERHGWDGQWYRRAFFDNGEPLGSQSSPECQIDSLPQSWSVISGAADPVRSRQGMESARQRLMHPASALVQLFDPPFDRSALDPGYIKGYLPGVRENGGQYTHAAIWMTMAFALAGEPEKAWELARMLNPIGHGATPDQIAVYKVEPYVVAADVYALAPHTGRGGWTWYTGSAGWMYRLFVETLLGLNLEGEQLRLTPRWPKPWTTCRIHYCHRQTQYHINFIKLPEGSDEPDILTLDGVPLAGNAVPLRSGGGEHSVEFKFRQDALLQ
jgi:cellobiose phosphorylase